MSIFDARHAGYIQWSDERGTGRCELCFERKGQIHPTSVTLGNGQVRSALRIEAHSACLDKLLSEQGYAFSHRQICYTNHVTHVSTYCELGAAS